MKKKKPFPKRKALMREIDKRKFPFVSVEDKRTGKLIIHPLIPNG